MNQSFEYSLLEAWITEMQHCNDVYREPILDEKTVSVIKLACDTFKQDAQIFFMTVDLLEQYVYEKEFRHEKIADVFLVMNVILFITSKYFGGGADLKIPLLQKFMLKVSGEHYHCHGFMKTEQEVLEIFDYKLPFSTVLDDLETFFEKFMKEYCLQQVLRPLGVEILLLIYCSKQRLFESLKSLYEEEQSTLRTLICSKLYLPAGILISAFKSTNYQFIVDINRVTQDLRVFTRIHPSHIHTLSAIILRLMKA